MALNKPVIKILSKDIYEIDNQKFIDNQIDKIEVQVKNPVPDNHYNQTVYNEYTDSTLYTNGNPQEDVDGYGDNSSGGGFVVAYVKVTPFYIEKQFAIPKKLSNTSKINKIELSPIRYSTVCIEKNGVATATLNYTYKGLQQTDGFSFYNILTDYPTTNQDKQIVLLPQEYEKTASGKLFEGIASPVVTRKAELTLTDQTNLELINEDEQYYYLSGLFLCGEEIVEIGHFEDYPSGQGGTSKVISVSGTSTLYKPIQISITIYGNTIGIDLQDQTITIGNGNNVYSFTGNELIQTTNTYKMPIKLKKGFLLDLFTNEYKFEVIGNSKLKENDKIEYQDETATVTSVEGNEAIIRCARGGKLQEVFNGRTITATLLGDIYSKYQTVIQSWQNGKEVATIRCGIEDYYDTNNNLVISPTTENLPMVFDIGDIVIPYIYGANGQDKPMSVYTDNTPKQFRVVQTNISYDGAIWQTLTLQEVEKV